MKKLLTVSLLLLAGFPLQDAVGASIAPTAAATSVTLTPRELFAAVQALLSAYEPLDIDRTLPALGSPAAVAEALLALARDPGTAPTAAIVRVRAIEALGYVPTDAGLLYLHGLVAELGDATDSRVYQLAAALRALGHFGDGELGRLGPYLSHPSADVREAAAMAMAAMPAARPLLQRRLAVESERGVQAVLQSSLKQLAAPPKARQVR
jgi:hypothetical protein